MKIKYSIILWLFLFIQSSTIVMANEIEQKEAIKECKKAFKVKSCELVIAGMSEENYFKK